MRRIVLQKVLLSGVLIFLSAICSFGQDVFSTARTSPRGIVSFAETVTSGALNAGKYVDGYVKKYGTSSFIFPVGDNGVLRPFAAAGDETVGAYFMVNPSVATDPSGAPFDITKVGDGLARVSGKEFWDIDGTNSTKLTLTWNTASGIGTLTENKLEKLIISGWKTSTGKWEKIASTVDETSLTGGASTLTAGSITTNSALNPDTYSVYTLSSLPADALPVTLISFKVLPSEAKTVLLTWATSTETNSEKFSVERSPDAKSWTLIGNVDAIGESSAVARYDFEDASPLHNENFYRLKMVDRDGTFAYSSIEHTKIGKEQLLVIYPNPVSDRLFVQNPLNSDITGITFYNMSGQKVYQAGPVPQTGVGLGSLVSGKYVVSILLENGTTQKYNLVVNK